MLCDIALLLRILAERVHTAELASGVRIYVFIWIVSLHHSPCSED